MSAAPKRLYLVHGPTPIERRAALDEIVGAEMWIKRDDVTGGAEAGNKVRKLEYLLADALAKKAELVITCGGIQSNHARATALVCARLGLRSVLYLRVSDPTTAKLGVDGNVLLDRLAGAEICFISPLEWRERTAIMEHARHELAKEGVPAYVVPEGGSNGLGAIGYVEAMREVKEQLALGLCGDLRTFDVVAHACGSGGTAAGVALGAALHGVAKQTWAFAVCDDRAYFEGVIGRIADEARGFDRSLPSLSDASITIDDRAKGPAYSVMAPEQKDFLVRVARKTGIVLDPTYTGKALFGVKKAVERGDIPRGARVLFLHTGGLPGLLAQGEELRETLAAEAR
jgi:D-cysteine desulfhydrase